MVAELPDWMPPVAGSEAAHLLGALNRMRATFRWKADGLDAAALAYRMESSELSIGGLLKHLARVEDEVATVRLDGSAVSAVFANATSDGEGDHEFESASSDAPETLYALYDNAVRRAQQRVGAIVDDHGLDFATALRGPGGQQASLRRLLFDLLEEYGRHTGHTDLLREAIDGRAGEDPPLTWSPHAT